MCDPRDLADIEPHGTCATGDNSVDYWVEMVRVRGAAKNLMRQNKNLMRQTQTLLGEIDRIIESQGH